MTEERTAIKKALISRVASQIHTRELPNLLRSVRDRTFSDSIQDGVVRKWSSPLFIAVLRFFLDGRSLRKYILGTEIPRALIQITHASVSLPFKHSPLSLR